MLPLGLLTAGEKGEIIDSSGKKKISISRRSDESKIMNNCRIDDMGLRTGEMIEILVQQCVIFI